MTKAVQITMWTGGFLAALIVVGLVVFAAIFDINDYKAHITRLVRDRTGRTLTFSGDLGLMFFPRPGLRVAGAALSNAPGFGDGPMASVRSASASFRLLPLFSGKVEVGHIYLDGLELHLARNAAGATNWDDLARREQPAGSGSDGSGVGTLEVDGVAVEHSAVTWDDRRADISLSLGDMALALGRIRPGVPFRADLSFSFVADHPAAHGDVTVGGRVTLADDGLTVAHPAVTVRAEGAGVPGGKGSLDGKAETLALVADRLAVRGLTLSGYGATAHFDGAVNGLAKGAEQLVGTVTVDPLDGRALWASLTGAEPDTADAKALSLVGGTAVIAYTPRSLALKGLDLRVDDNGLRGEARIAGNDDGVSCFARMDADTMDLDRYLPPENARAGEDATARSTGPEARLPRADRLRRLTVDVEAAAARVHARGVWLDNVKIGLTGRDGLFRLNPASADLYGGRVSLAATLNALTDRPRTDLLVAVDKVDVGPLSADLLGDADYAGKLDFKGTFACEGERRSAMLASLNGKFTLDLADGVFPGVDLLGMARTTQASGRKEGTVEASAGDATRFGSIHGTGVIKNGLLENHNLEVKAPGLRAEGEGAVSLPTGRIDYLLKVKLVPTAQGQGGRAGSDMFGIMVPVRVTGTVDAPRYSVSLTEYVKALGGAVIGVAGTVFKGVTDVISTVGKAVVGGGEDNATATKRNGLHNLFGLF